MQLKVHTTEGVIGVEMLDTWHINVDSKKQSTITANQSTRVKNVNTKNNED